MKKAVVPVERILTSPFAFGFAGLRYSVLEYKTFVRYPKILKIIE